MAFCNIISDPDKIVILTDGKWNVASRSGRSFVCGDVSVGFDITDGKAAVSLTADSTPVSAVVLRWKHEIGRGTRVLGDHWERAYADLRWTAVYPDRAMPWYFLANDGRTTDGYGVMTGCKSFCHFQVSPDMIDLVMDVRCGGSGVILGGRTLDAATVVARQGSEGESAFDAGRAFCRMMCEKPRLPSEPVYGSNNWYYAYGNITAESVMTDSRLLAGLTEGIANRPYMVIDDGWQMDHAFLYNGGPWSAGNKDFPDMEKLAHDMADAGTRPGIWLRPLNTHREECKHLLLQNESGRGGTPTLDVTIPEAMEMVAADIRRIAGWGFKLIKHDFSSADITGRWGFGMINTSITGNGWSFSDRSVTTAEAVLKLYNGIRNAAGEDTLIIGCNTFSHLSAGIFELQRTGDDTSGTDWVRTREFGVNTVAFRSIQHDAFYACDGDCVGITDKISWKYNRLWLDLLAKSGTPLFVSPDPAVITDEQKAALRTAFEIASKPQPLGEPLDWMDTNCPTLWKLQGKEVRYNWTDEDIPEAKIW